MNNESTSGLRLIQKYRPKRPAFNAPCIMHIFVFVVVTIDLIDLIALYEQHADSHYPKRSLNLVNEHVKQVHILHIFTLHGMRNMPLSITDDSMKIINYYNARILWWWVDGYRKYETLMQFISYSYKV
uniref:Uncharacterized protein n=1 Tax=Glossina austeni TaxID=7395 RepID=A0A1A9V4H7_GLOAU